MKGGKEPLDEGLANGLQEEEIPDPGDHLRYDIAGVSFIIVRQLDGSIKTFPNACLHRGRMLKEFDGHASELRCAFHGFGWNLDGCLKDVLLDGTSLRSKTRSGPCLTSPRLLGLDSYS